jgi:hypothetical protein
LTKGIGRLWVDLTISQFFYAGRLIVSGGEANNANKAGLPIIFLKLFGPEAFAGGPASEEALCLAELF